MRPHDIGFDEFYGFYEAEKEISQGVDKRRYPDLVLNPERLEMLRSTGSSNALVHGLKGGETTDVEVIDSIEEMAEGDRMLKEFTLAKIPELAAGGKPFFLEHAFMKVHADNFASKEFEGKSASEISLQGRRGGGRRLCRRDRRCARRGGRARQHLRLRHLRQRPAAR